VSGTAVKLAKRIVTAGRVNAKARTERFLHPCKAFLVQKG